MQADHLAKFTSKIEYFLHQFQIPSILENKTTILTLKILVATSENYVTKCCEEIIYNGLHMAGIATVGPVRVELQLTIDAH